MIVHQKIRPKDVPGTLLNMALLNLGSSDPNLRTAAYNLLCALTATFDLKIEGQLLETSGEYLIRKETEQGTSKTYKTKPNKKKLKEDNRKTRLIGKLHKLFLVLNFY